jgi:hypothetical protein
MASAAAGGISPHSNERGADFEPVSPELVLVCPELRARVLAQMQEAVHATAQEQPAAPRLGDDRSRGVPRRPAAALLAATSLSLLAGAWLGATTRGALTGAPVLAASAGATQESEAAASRPDAVARLSGPTAVTHARAPYASKKLRAPGRGHRAPGSGGSSAPLRAPAPVSLPGAETEPPVSLLGPLPRRRLASTLGRQLLALAQARRVSWALLLARARLRTSGTMRAVELGRLRPIARSLASSAHPTRRERVLAGYYRAVGLDALISGLAGAKPILAARVLRDPRITIYPGGRDDVAAGRVDVRVLALLLYLAQTQGQVTVSSLVSGHDPERSPQGASAHTYGLAVDISALAYTPVRGHQLTGRRIDRALRSLRLLPAEVRPAQLISLLDLGPGSLVLADHSGFVHVSYALATHNTPDELRALWQSAGARYGVPWQILAAINKLESDNGQVLGTSSAGAVGWMQFLPATWRQYGIDANGDGTANPLDPADAIYSAARYLRAAGAGTNLRHAIYAYNHAPWYVKRVLAAARTYR